MFSQPDGLSEWVDVKDKWNFRAGCIEVFTVDICTYGSEFLVRRKNEECWELTYILSCP